MKKLFFIALVLLFELAQVRAQTSICSPYPLLKGLYQLELDCQQSNNSYAITLKNNLPGMYQIDMACTIRDTNGVEHEEIIQKRQVGKDIMLLKSLTAIEQLIIQKFSIRYTRFGEAYCLDWNQTSGVPLFSKQGKEYMYANPFTVCATEFYWPHADRQKDLIILPAESCKVSAN